MLKLRDPSFKMLFFLLKSIGSHLRCCEWWAAIAFVACTVTKVCEFSSTLHTEYMTFDADTKLYATQIVKSYKEPTSVSSHKMAFQRQNDTKVVFRSFWIYQPFS